jgi:Uma2 family endonuclease
MSLPHSHISYSTEEYLVIERGSAERHEYLDGHVYAMAGESPEHGTICTNIGGQLYNQLRGKDCQAFSKDMKVRSGLNPQSGRTSKGFFSYPDLLVVCGEFRFTDEHRDVLLNPTPDEEEDIEFFDECPFYFFDVTCYSKEPARGSDAGRQIRRARMLR